MTNLREFVTQLDQFSGCIGQIAYFTSASEVLLHNGEVSVPLGRKVVIDPNSDLKIRVNPGDRCNVKVGSGDKIEYGGVVLGTITT